VRAREHVEIALDSPLDRARGEDLAERVRGWTGVWVVRVPESGERMLVQIDPGRITASELCQRLLELGLEARPLPARVPTERGSDPACC